MKHKFAASAALFLFALALFAGCERVHARCAGFAEFHGESVYGDASAAEGITVTQRAVLERRVTWELSYDAGRMSGESEERLEPGYGRRQYWEPARHTHMEQLLFSSGHRRRR